MRLLFFIGSLSSGGAERITTQLANYWAARDNEVAIVTLSGPESDFYPLHPGVRRIALNLAGDSGGLMRAVGNNLRRVRALRRALLETRPDVAVAMMAPATVLLALAGFRIPGLVTIGAERSYPPLLPLGSLWRFLRSRTYGRFSAVVAQTSETREWLCRHTNARNVHVIPNAVEFPLPSAPPLLPPQRWIGAGRKVLLAVGRLVELKGFGPLLATFGELAEKHPQWDLVILGEGPQRAELEQTVAALGLSGRVLLPGLAGNVGDWYAAADLFALTSRFEGFPNTLLEAMASGVPAVAFDCDTGPRDIIRHGVDGLLVPPGDHALLRQSLDRLMGDEAKRLAYGAKALETRDRFSLAVVASQWETLFRSRAEKCR